MFSCLHKVHEFRLLLSQEQTRVLSAANKTLSKNAPEGFSTYHVSVKKVSFVKFHVVWKCELNWRKTFMLQCYSVLIKSEKFQQSY